jgi:hypothetical protein
MIDIPMKAEVYCSDGIAGVSKYVIGNSSTRRMTHLVVKSSRPPFSEHLVPIAQVDETAPKRITLKCSQEDLRRMEPFEYEENVRTELPGYQCRGDKPLLPTLVTETVATIVPVKHQNILQGEIALQRGARVEATDGYIGQVDDVLINSSTMEVTNLVLLKSHILKGRQILIPVSQVDRVFEDKIYLKLDRQSVEELSTHPIQHWSQDDQEISHFEKGA